MQVGAEGPKFDAKEPEKNLKSFAFFSHLLAFLTTSELPYLGGGVFYVVAPFFFKINLKILSLKVCADFVIEFDLLEFFVFFEYLSLL